MSQNLTTPFARELLARNVFDQARLIEIQEASQRAGLDLISYLQTKKIVDERLIAELISKTFGFQLRDLTSIALDYIPDDLLDEKICTANKIMPLTVNGGTFEVALSNPVQTTLDAIAKLGFKSGLKPKTVVATFEQLDLLINRHFSSYALNSSISDISSEELMHDLGLTANSSSSDAYSEIENEEAGPLINFVNGKLLEGIKRGASDLHFEPFEDIYRIRFRIDGVMKLVETVNLQLASRITSRLKVIAKMDISEKRNPQDGRITLKVSDKKRIDFRVSSLPTIHGEKIVLRILDPSSIQIGIESLGYEEEQKQMFLDALKKPQGMILITGPTGSGKTVSLYTGLSILNTLDVNISTAEDPVEINLPGVNQVHVSNKTGLTFASALRAFLRQDPDIIMVGEIRDLETAEIAIKAAQTGHMVMSTLHTNSAPETLTRLRNMGVPAFNVATSVNLVIAQRLARRLCSNCKKEVNLETIPENTLIELGFTVDQINAPNFKIYEPFGCSGCSAGYRGRVGIYEVMKITSKISKLIMEEGNAIDIAEASKAEGYDDLRKSGIKKIIAGLTSIQEVMRVTSD